MLWEIGASQSNAAALTTENIDWPSRTLTYFRMKTGEQAQMAISKRLEAILNQLPTEGPLFPSIAKTNANARAAEFCRHCGLLDINGVSLHSLSLRLGAVRQMRRLSRAVRAIGFGA